MSTLGIGIDLVEVSRIRALLERSGDRFKERVFTPNEIDYCDSCADAPIHYAARFAAKEATVKALGTGFTEGINWKDIEVLRNEKGAPSLYLHGQAAQVAERLGVRQTFLSLSHTYNTAGANVSLMG
ncbi:MAG: holo-[acyl-carrier-protein] synthase [Verrucomicrobiota bacterium]|jgi:holo-[acyl-carrier protein] synthase